MATTHGTDRTRAGRLSRGASLAITHPALGTITLRQFSDWATGHIIRHNAQVKRVLGA